MNTEIDITFIIELIIALASAIITTFVIPILRSRLSAEKYENLKSWTKVAVKAAEQLFGSKAGLQKKEYVIAFLLSKGLVFDTDEVTAMIESEVYKLHTSTPEQP